MHEDGLAIDVELVRRLVATSFPECAELSLTPLAASGSSNAMFRMGDELLVRLPRQPGGSASVEKEARWLPTMSAGLSAPVPEIVGLGAADHFYPETWAVVRWIDGHPPEVPWDPVVSGSSRGMALDLAQVVADLRRIEVPPAARVDPDLESYRGGPLAEIDEDFRPWVAACRELPGLDLDLDRALSVWQLALAARDVPRARTRMGPRRPVRREPAGP